MGDEILKKLTKYRFLSLFFLLLLPCLSFSASTLSLGNDVKQYDKIFEKLTQTRVGVENREINRIKNPFVVVYSASPTGKKAKKAKRLYSLNAIFDKKVMINGRWYKRYAKIGAYRLIKIRKNSVILRGMSTSKELFIRKNNDFKIKFSSK